jgi:predicted O-methyltransferase YrrM
MASAFPGSEHPTDARPPGGGEALGIAFLSATLKDVREKIKERTAQDQAAEASEVSEEPAASMGVHENHPFFHYYGQLVHQQNMLQDATRTGSYHKAFISNPVDFRGKVVVDVGTGSGILAFFAAKAGARKVYAIEASDAAEHARKLLTANGMGDRIEVIKAKVGAGIHERCGAHCVRCRWRRWSSLKRLT